MARYLGPKYKLARRYKADLGLKTEGTKSYERLKRKINLPVRYTGKRRRKISEYGKQLSEKQKAKYTYGILERQLRRYFDLTGKKRNTGILQLLERRLDNIVYRLGFAPTRTSARQFVAHGHIFVNQKKVNIPSYLVEPGGIITLSAKAMEIPAVKKMLAEKNPVVGKWLERKGPAGRMIKIPEREEIETDINEQLIIEYYSR